MQEKSIIKSNVPWVKKYQPKNSNEIYGQNKGVETLRDFIKNYKKQKFKAAMIYGEPGCGKTSSVHAVSKEFDLEIHEINASDARNSDAINQRLGAIMGQQSLFFKEKLILIDEVDGIAGTEDRGGLTALSKLIENTRYPLIMTANNPYDKKFNDLRKKSLMIEFHGLSYPSIFNVLQKIADCEKIEYDEIALTAVARRAGGDLRGAITDLQTLTSETKKLKLVDLNDLSDRKKTESIITALMKVFKTTNPEVALTAFENIDEDNDEIFLWIDENLPHEYKKPLDLARAYENVALADIYRKRIKRWQHWRFLVYINDLLSAGVAVSKDEKYKEFYQYKPTMRLLRIWQTNMKFEKRKSIAIKVARKTHTSSKRVTQDVVPYLQIIFKKDKKAALNLSKEFDLSNDEVEWLKNK